MVWIADPHHGFRVPKEALSVGRGRPLARQESAARKRLATSAAHSRRSFGFRPRYASPGAGGPLTLGSEGATAMLLEEVRRRGLQALPVGDIL